MPPDSASDGQQDHTHNSAAGDSIVLITHNGAEYPAEIVRGPLLACGCHVIRWTGKRPLTGRDTNTVCFSEFKEVRRG